MNKQEALNIVKQLIDIAVQKGIFSKADDVLTAMEAYNALVADNIQNQDFKKQ